MVKGDEVEALGRVVGFDGDKALVDFNPRTLSIKPAPVPMSRLTMARAQPALPEGARPSGDMWIECPEGRGFFVCVRGHKFLIREDGVIGSDDLSNEGFRAFLAELSGPK